MKKIVAFLFVSTTGLFAFAQDDSCLVSKDLYVKDFCQISYVTLAQVQAMQINALAPADLDITKMEQVLTIHQIKENDIKIESWVGYSKMQKANHSFKVLLEKTGQTQDYLKGMKSFNIESLPQLNMDQKKSTSTGTRGGGLGNETYILPQGFWIE